MVNLKDVARKYNFGSFACTGDDGFDFMWREVVGFVNNKENFDEAAPSNIS